MHAPFPSVETRGWAEIDTGHTHVAWMARQAKSPSPLLRGREIPAQTSIELWARFPRLATEGRSPLEAIERILIQLR